MHDRVCVRGCEQGDRAMRLVAALHFLAVERHRLNGAEIERIEAVHGTARAGATQRAGAVHQAIVRENESRVRQDAVRYRRIEGMQHAQLTGRIDPEDRTTLRIEESAIQCVTVEESVAEWRELIARPNAVGTVEAVEDRDLAFAADAEQRTFARTAIIGAVEVAVLRLDHAADRLRAGQGRHHGEIPGGVDPEHRRRAARFILARGAVERVVLAEEQRTKREDAAAVRETEGVNDGHGVRLRIEAIDRAQSIAVIDIAEIAAVLRRAVVIAVLRLNEMAGRHRRAATDKAVAEAIEHLKLASRGDAVKNAATTAGIRAAAECRAVGLAAA